MATEDPPFKNVRDVSGDPPKNGTLFPEASHTHTIPILLWEWYGSSMGMGVPLRDPFSVDMLVCQRLTVVDSLSFLCFFVGHKVLQRVHL